MHNMLTDQFVGNPSTACTKEQFECTSPHQCISGHHRCDGTVECIDASDEQECDCDSRLDVTKKCDFIFDCPDGEDELGCFGCRADEYSCYENEKEFNEHERQPQCFRHTHRCDGIPVCENQRDEWGCTILSNEAAPTSNKLFPLANGILHQYRGSVAYPVCTDQIGLKEAACFSLLGDNFQYDIVFNEKRHVSSNYKNTSGKSNH